MANGNALYDRMADSWWDADGFLHALTESRDLSVQYIGHAGKPPSK